MSQRNEKSNNKKTIDNSSGWSHLVGLLTHWNVASWQWRLWCLIEWCWNGATCWPGQMAKGFSESEPLLGLLPLLSPLGDAISWFISIYFCVCSSFSIDCRDWAETLFGVRVLEVFGIFDDIDFITIRDQKETPGQFSRASDLSICR